LPLQIVVRQISGLGNQMFQYAAGRYYAKRYGAQMRVAVDPARNAVSHGYPRPFLLSHFAITAPAKEISPFDRLVLTSRRLLKPASVALRQSLGIQVFREKFERRYSFMEDLQLQQNVRMLYLIGYWQAHRLADDIADELRAEFSFNEPAQGKNLEILDQIGQSHSSVSLHVRRGDFTLAAEGNIALPMSYYAQAISRFRERLGDPTFFVFSDDIAFTKEHLPRGIRTIFVDNNDSSSSHEDLRLMSACQHHIIANSTFSWWGAWLNPRTDKMVVAPRYWHLKPGSYYPDLLPPNWMLAEIPDSISA
jgi:hypothetical protein